MLRRAVHQHQLHKFVRFLGYLPEETLAVMYRLAGVFVFPSLYEGFGLPPLEAMASGTPVVTSNVSSLPEVAGDAAVLVDPYDAQAIADGIYRVLTDETLPDLRKKGVARGMSRGGLSAACTRSICRQHNSDALFWIHASARRGEEAVWRGVGPHECKKSRSSTLAHRRPGGGATAQSSASVIRRRALRCSMRLGDVDHRRGGASSALQLCRRPPLPGVPAAPDIVGVRSDRFDRISSHCVPVGVDGSDAIHLLLPHADAAWISSAPTSARIASGASRAARCDR